MKTAIALLFLFLLSSCYDGRLREMKKQTEIIKSIDSNNTELIMLRKFKDSVYNSK